MIADFIPVIKGGLFILSPDLGHPPLKIFPESHQIHEKCVTSPLSGGLFLCGEFNGP